MIFALQRKKDKLFYSANCRWVEEIEKAKLFNRKRDLFLWLDYRPNGLFFYERKLRKYGTTNMKDVNVVSVELIITGVQKQIQGEYKTKQLLKEIERGNKNDKK